MRYLGDIKTTLYRKAAKLAGYTRLEFIRKLQAENEPIFDYDEALIDEMINSAKTTPHVVQE